jgi:hypothetical protein
MPAEQVMQKFKTRGYQKLRKLDMEYGCYEAKGINAEGNRVEVYLDPPTGEVVKVGSRDLHDFSSLGAASLPGAGAATGSFSSVM